MWIWTSRPGFEEDLREELAGGRASGPSLVASPDAPARWPTFARAGFPVSGEGPPSGAAALAIAALDSVKKGPWLMQAWVPDHDQTNPLAATAQSLGDRVAVEIGKLRPDLDLRRVPKADEAVRYGGVLLQLCLVAADRVLVGAIPAGDAPTLAAGGRSRSTMPADAPSRAGRKLTEALEWMGRGPEAGELCVDLGAAPGGWTAVLLQRRAQVIAVDPAKLAPSFKGRKGLAHVQASAFEFSPSEPVDWLFCDMAWRPLEVAALLAKWGKRRWAGTLCANVKLPMKQRVRFANEVRKIVEGGGWRDVRTRQLYHDREEITLAAWRT